MHPVKEPPLLSLGLGFKPELTGRDNALLSRCCRAPRENRRRPFWRALLNFLSWATPSSPGEKLLCRHAGAPCFHHRLDDPRRYFVDRRDSQCGRRPFPREGPGGHAKPHHGEQTVVFVSHMADQVKQLCDRVIWLDQGKIVAEGDSEEVTMPIARMLRTNAKRA